MLHDDCHDGQNETDRQKDGSVPGHFVAAAAAAADTFSSQMIINPIEEITSGIYLYGDDVLPRLALFLLCLRRTAGLVVAVVTVVAAVARWG